MRKPTQTPRWAYWCLLCGVTLGYHDDNCEVYSF